MNRVAFDVYSFWLSSWLGSSFFEPEFFSAANTYEICKNFFSISFYLFSSFSFLFPVSILCIYSCNFSIFSVVISPLALYSISELCHELSALFFKLNYNFNNIMNSITSLNWDICLSKWNFRRNSMGINWLKDQSTTKIANF